MGPNRKIDVNSESVNQCLVTGMLARGKCVVTGIPSRSKKIRTVVILVMAVTGKEKKLKASPNIYHMNRMLYH